MTITEAALSLYRRLDPDNPIRHTVRSLRASFRNRARRHAQTTLERNFPDKSDFVAYAGWCSPLKTRTYADFTNAEKALYLEAQPGLCTSPDAAISLMRDVEYIIDSETPGAFVECGVFQAANVHIMIRMLQQLGVGDRDVYLYDTFAGMPKPSEVDDEGLNNALKVTYETFRTEEGSDWMCAGLDQVRARIDALGYPSERIHYVKGMVEDTVPAQAPEQIALLRLDTDFYSSTKHELVHLYPRISAAGGVLIIDDYGGMPGCRTAVEEYASEHRPGWLLNRIDAHVRQVVKPK